MREDQFRAIQSAYEAGVYRTESTGGSAGQQVIGMLLEELVELRANRANVGALIRKYYGFQAELEELRRFYLAHAEEEGK